MRFWKRKDVVVNTLSVLSSVCHTHSSQGAQFFKDIFLAEISRVEYRSVEYNLILNIIDILRIINPNT